MCDQIAVRLRLRGEDLLTPVADGSGRGSPPLARRGRPGAARSGWPWKLTSAHAERTDAASDRASSPPAHLRLRGDHVMGPSWVRHAAGSPPPARRGHDDRPQGGGAGRFTSARAERTGTVGAGVGRTGVHLRSRGEDPARSPRPSSRGRFTSARAERTPSRPAVLGALCQFVIQGTPVMHPPEPTGAARPLAGIDLPATAQRGDRDLELLRGDQVDGSPPPARKAHPGPLQPRPHHRFTSARAETTRRYQWF